MNRSVGRSGQSAPRAARACCRSGRHRTDTLSTVNPPDRRAELKALVEAAEAGVSGAVEELRWFVMEWPAAEVLLQRMVPTAGRRG